MKSTIILILVLMISYSKCYPSGGPLAQCSSMKPNHRNSITISTSSPYTIHVDKFDHNYNGIIFCDHFDETI